MSGLTIDNLSVGTAQSRTPLLRSVSLTVPQGVSHAVIGDQGSGKTLIGNTLLGILPYSLEASASHLTCGTLNLSTAPRQDIAGAIALIPQDPRSALLPSHRIGTQFLDRLTRIHGRDKQSAMARTREVFDAVELNPDTILPSYPGEIDVSLRARVLIAAAFVGNPDVVYADAPTAGLDGPQQKHHLHLLQRLQAAQNTTLVLATRDPGVAARVCRRASVLFEGAVVEDADMRTLLAVPAHPYSQALLNVTPRYDDPRAGRGAIPASVIAATRAEVAARHV